MYCAQAVASPAAISINESFVLVRMPYRVCDVESVCWVPVVTGSVSVFVLMTLKMRVSSNEKSRP